MADGFYTNDDSDDASFYGYGCDDADDGREFGNGFSAPARPASAAASGTDTFGACGAQKTARSGFFTSLFRGGGYRRAA